MILYIYRMYGVTLKQYLFYIFMYKMHILFIHATYININTPHTSMYATCTFYVSMHVNNIMHANSFLVRKYKHKHGVAECC